MLTPVAVSVNVYDFQMIIINRFHVSTLYSYQLVKVKRVEVILLSWKIQVLSK